MIECFILLAFLVLYLAGAALMAAYQRSQGNEDLIVVALICWPVVVLCAVFAAQKQTG